MLDSCRSRRAGVVSFQKPQDYVNVHLHRFIKRAEYVHTVITVAKCSGHKFVLRLLVSPPSQSLTSSLSHPFLSVVRDSRLINLTSLSRTCHSPPQTLSKPRAFMRRGFISIFTCQLMECAFINFIQYLVKSSKY